MKTNNHSQRLLPLLTAVMLSLCLGCASLPSLSSLTPAALKSGLFQTSSSGRSAKGANDKSKPPITSPGEESRWLGRSLVREQDGGRDDWSEDDEGVRLANFQSYQDPQEIQIPLEEWQAMQEGDAMQATAAEMQDGYGHQEGQAVSQQSMSAQPPADASRAFAGGQPRQYQIGQQGQSTMGAQTMDPNVLGIGQLRGREFRPRQDTATELLIACKERNQSLEVQLQVGKEERQKLTTQIAIQNQAITELKMQLEEANGMIRDLRQQVAKYQIQNETLRNEKVMIKQNADRALRRIEAELDALLLRSVSKAIETTENGR